MSDGEEWKGEESKADNWFSFPFHISVTPETPEQKAARERTTAEALAKAELLFVALPLFDRARACPKCRNPNEAKTLFCAGVGMWNGAGGCKGETGAHEHFHRTCRLCKYDWLERCLGEE